MEQATVQEMEEAIGQAAKDALQGVVCYRNAVEQNLRLPALFITQEKIQVTPLLGRRKKIVFTYRLTYLTRSERGPAPQAALVLSPAEAVTALTGIRTAPFGARGTLITWKKTQLTEDKAELWLELTIFGALEEAQADPRMEVLLQRGGIKEE